MSDVEKARLHSMFKLYCNATESTTERLSTERVKEWFVLAGIVGTKTGITNDDVEEVFSKILKGKTDMGYEELKNCITELAKERQLDAKGLKERLSNTSPPAYKQD
ncbi:hypothetical protein CEXT_550421 [Caerostris extrusa]|uniref:Uncharacterized protein n=1 Tax=Caerostris extrusa TaxID=172846 RepID=A0AAV4RY77_CAEEX|nr:hypothetical protein CEXT_550421 [Caerostris extrusa]